MVIFLIKLGRTFCSKFSNLFFHNSYFLIFLHSTPAPRGKSGGALVTPQWEESISRGGKGGSCSPRRAAAAARERGRSYVVCGMLPWPFPSSAATSLSSGSCCCPEIGGGSPQSRKSPELGGGVGRRSGPTARTAAQNLGSACKTQPAVATWTGPEKRPAHTEMGEAATYGRARGTLLTWSPGNIRGRANHTRSARNPERTRGKLRTQFTHAPRVRSASLLTLKARTAPLRHRKEEEGMRKWNATLKLSEKEFYMTVHFFQF